MTADVLLRAADRTVRRWKNGGGTTQDIAFFPTGSDLPDFDWRLSIADVRDAGPFSVFPGIDRHLAILSGAMAITIAGLPDRPPLTKRDGALSFPGDAATTGTPIGGPVRDLNLMVRRGVFSGRLDAHEDAVLTTAHEINILVARAAGIIVVDGLARAMSPLDALRLPGGCAVESDVPLLLAGIDRVSSSRRP